METQHQKWVTVSYVAAAALLSFVLFEVSQKVVGAYDLEARLRNIDLMVRGFSIFVGLSSFFLLYRNDKVNQFMSEVVVELSRVTWPTQKETTSATLLVVIMVLVSGMVLGFLDYLWTVLLKWVL